MDYLDYRKVSVEKGSLKGTSGRQTGNCGLEGGSRAHSIQLQSRSARNPPLFIPCIKIHVEAIIDGRWQCRNGRRRRFQ
jgi:hypothetical protein